MASLDIVTTAVKRKVKTCNYFIDKSLEEETKDIYYLSIPKEINTSSGLGLAY